MNFSKPATIAFVLLSLVVPPLATAHAQALPPPAKKASADNGAPADSNVPADNGAPADSNAPAERIVEPPAPLAVTQPVRPAPVPSHIFLHFAAGAGVPMGDASYGLKPFDPEATEFFATPNLSLGVGFMPPGKFVALGVRMDIGFGALASDKWTKALGVEVANSVVFDLAIFAQFHHRLGGAYSLVFGADGGFVLLGTATDAADHDVDKENLIEHSVAYTGASGAAYIGLHRSLNGQPDGPVEVFVQLRFAYRSWRGLSADGPSQMPPLRDDVRGMKLNHIGVYVGLSAFSATSSRRNRAM